VNRWSELTLENLPLIPLKKMLLLPSDPLWERRGGEYLAPPEPPALALVGIPPCDLYGLEYLDRVFAEDSLYRRRRERLLVVGTLCTPDETCFCPPRPGPPPFDIFLAPGRAWSGSGAGEALLAELELRPESAPRSLPDDVVTGSGPALPANLEAMFFSSRKLPLWSETAGRCLSCGACSAVCPTCYCYDVVDAAEVGGAVRRRREWDNCFFRSHALVAGGHNFRPGRSDRLRFRFEHKLLGFGDLRGVSSCVGCGRCGRACPVDIDIAEVLAALKAGGRS
jgi:ferredoxin